MYIPSEKPDEAFERIAAALPGFRGYKEKELRRESDKLVRTHLALKLEKEKITFEASAKK
jgi:hypothetical protein